MNAIVVLNLKFYEQALNSELFSDCTVQVSRNAKNCVVRYNIIIKVTTTKILTMSLKSFTIYYFRLQTFCICGEAL